jgi:hypothetical protein
MEYTLKINITEANNDYVQDLILKLTMLGVIDQDIARDIFIKAEKLKGIYIR